MKVVLHQPQIPQNAGNIVRTCAVTGSDLVMVRPLGFNISDRQLKRAGLDYWETVNIRVVDNFEEFISSQEGNFYFFSSRVKKIYTEISYQEGDMLIFGSESDGLPKHYFDRWPNSFHTIPMLPNSRCLNLSNAVAIVIYEAWRQGGFRFERR